MLDVDKVLSSHYPQLEQRDWLKRPVRQTLKRLLHEQEFQAFAKRYPHLQGFEFIEQVLDYFNFSYRVSDREKERIPESGRVVIIANHPIGSLDGLALLKLVRSVRPDVKVMANELLMQVDPLHSCLLPVNNMGGHTPKQNLTKITQWLEHDGALIIFPAGEVSRVAPTGIRDGAWHPGFFTYGE